MSDYSSLHAPLLRVSRPVSACSRCRSAKVKCDGKLPACSACERSGKAHECTGGSDQFARGKERSYIASLESRIEKLEKKLNSLPQRRGSIAMVGGDSTAGTNGDFRSELPLSSTKEKAKESGDIENIISDFGYMTINACTRDFYKSVTRMSFDKIVLKASAASKSLDNVPRAQLPPRHLAHGFIQHYFDKIFPLTPCLSEPSFFLSLDMVYKNDPKTTNFDRFVVFMVLAVGTLSLSRSRTSSAAQQAACFVKTALDYVEGVISPATIMGVQATLLLLQYSMLEPTHFNSWYLIGVASRIAIDIGLHHENAKVLKLKASELDLRRRIFYCVYSYDRSISMVLQRPFSFSDDSISVPFPKSIQAASPKENWKGTLVSMAAARHLFSLRKLQSAWYQKYYHTGDSPLEDAESYTSARRDELEAWSKNLPDGITPVMQDWLTLEYHYIQVYASAPCPKVPQPSDAAWLALFTHCTNYALRFADILGDPNHRIVYTFHDALRTYYVGSNLLHAIYQKEELVLNENTIPVAMDAIKATIHILSAMIERWEDAGPLVGKFSIESNRMLDRLEMKNQQVLQAREERRREMEMARQREEQIQRDRLGEEQKRLQQEYEAQQQQQRRQQYFSSSQQQGLQDIQYPTWTDAGPQVTNPSTGAVTAHEIFFSHITTQEFGNVAFYRYS